MQLRSHSMLELKTAIPAPRLPSSAVAGTSQSSSTTSLIGEVVSPILWNGGPTVSPGESRSTRNADSPAKPAFGSVDANTTNTSATGALVMNVLAPFSTNASPRCAAEVVSPNASEPESGSVIAWTPIIEPSQRGGR